MNETSPRVLETVAGPAALDEVHQCLDEFWSAHGEVPDIIRTQVSIAAAEVAANIIEHAGKGRPVEIRMEMRLHHGEVEINFHDTGIPAEIDLASHHMPSDTAERGRGLALAQAVLASLAYRFDDTGNTWTLISERFI